MNFVELACIQFQNKAIFFLFSLLSIWNIYNRNCSRPSYVPHGSQWIKLSLYQMANSQVNVQKMWKWDIFIQFFCQSYIADLPNWWFSNWYLRSTILTMQKSSNLVVNCKCMLTRNWILVFFIIKDHEKDE